MVSALALRPLARGQRALKNQAAAYPCCSAPILDGYCAELQTQLPEDGSAAPRKPEETAAALRADRCRRTRASGTRRLLCRRLRRRRGLDRQRLIGVEPNREQEIGFIGAPAVANAEIDRLGAPEQLRILRLILARKFRDRAGIAAERKEVPFLRAEIGERNTGIVLDDGRAAREDEVAHC